MCLMIFLSDSSSSFFVERSVYFDGAIMALLLRDENQGITQYCFVWYPLVQKNIFGLANHADNNNYLVQKDY